MLTIIAVIISIYANFTGAAWEEKFLPFTLVLIGLSAWKRKGNFI